MKMVIDASVAAKWLFSETDSDRAHDVLVEASKGRVSLISPEVLLAEIANVLWKRVLRDGVSMKDAAAQFDRFKRMNLAQIPTKSLVDSALQLAVARRRPVYDCLYVALALEIHCDFVTADEKLHRTFAHIPQVRLLRDWRP